VGPSWAVSSRGWLPPELDVEFTVYDGPQDTNSTPIDVGAFNFCID
jgi:hypothetical protein